MKDKSANNLQGKEKDRSILGMEILMKACSWIICSMVKVCSNIIPLVIITKATSYGRKDMALANIILT